MEEPMYQDEERVSDQAKTWLQDNLRIIVSIFIVAAIALGIYSYSQRAEEGMTGEETTAVSTEDGSSEGLLGQAETPTTSVNGATPKPAAAPGTALTVPAELSRETPTSFVETAQRGDGTTHLARRALMNYLEKNPDSGLSGEHKVYVEDWLRKQKPRTAVHVGTSMEFSKDMIKQAIDQSKTLTPKQLQNLKKYSSRVSVYRS